MADQDTDGFHIKGLLINFIHYYWPELIENGKFLYDFIKPIVRLQAKRGKEIKDFYNMQDFEQYIKTNDMSVWQKPKYYKGLGTFTALQSKQLFRNMKKHLVEYKHDESSTSNILLAFAKNNADKRKAWVSREVETIEYKDSDNKVEISEFINQEFVLFSMADNVRSIPSIMDGLKPGQRKVLYSAFKKNLKKEVKVSQLAGFVSESSAYHHGEKSLEGTIVNMARFYVGGNNVNLFKPNGQFGTKILNGNDSASPRYIFTVLQPYTRSIFKPADDKILQYVVDDGQKVEPVYYAPVFPTVLMNGADGIGTGYSTGVPSYNPVDIIENLKMLIKEGPEKVQFKDMYPWYRFFKGQVKPNLTKTSFQIIGTYQRIGATKMVRITELPVGMSIHAYKEYLTKLMLETKEYLSKKGKKPAMLIHDFKENHTSKFSTKYGGEIHDINFTVNFANMEELEQSLKLPYKFLNAMKLITTVHTTNMVLHDSNGVLKRYKNVNEIMVEYYRTRYRLYELRKKFELKVLKRDLKIKQEKVRYIDIFDEKIYKQSDEKQLQVLTDMEFKRIFPMKFGNNGDGYDGDSVEEAEVDASTSTEDAEASFKGYEYLRDMKNKQMTTKYIEVLKKDIKIAKRAYKTLRDKTIEDIWIEDLDELDLSDGPLQTDATHTH